MSRGLTGLILKGYGARDYPLTLIAKREIAPHYVRFRFSSPTLLEEIEWHPATWLRFWFPDPTGKRRELQRAYTLVAAYPRQGEFEVDVLIHQPLGPATLWFTAAQPGDTLTGTFLGSRFRMPEPEPAGFLLIADACSIPAINNIITAAKPSTPIELYVETSSSQDEAIPLTTHPALTLQYVSRRGPDGLHAAIAHRARPGWFAWAAGEAGSMKRLHTALKTEHGFDKEAIHVQSYWAEAKHA